MLALAQARGLRLSAGLQLQGRGAHDSKREEEEEVNRGTEGLLLLLLLCCRRKRSHAIGCRERGSQGKSEKKITTVTRNSPGPTAANHR